MKENPIKGNQEMNFLHKKTNRICTRPVKKICKFQKSALKVTRKKAIGNITELIIRVTNLETTIMAQEEPLHLCKTL